MSKWAIFTHLRTFIRRSLGSIAYDFNDSFPTSTIAVSVVVATAALQRCKTAMWLEAVRIFSLDNLTEIRKRVLEVRDWLFVVTVPVINRRGAWTLMPIDQFLQRTFLRSQVLPPLLNPHLTNSDIASKHVALYMSFPWIRTFADGASYFVCDALQKSQGEKWNSALHKKRTWTQEHSMSAYFLAIESIRENLKAYQKIETTRRDFFYNSKYFHCIKLGRILIAY